MNVAKAVFHDASNLPPSPLPSLTRAGIPFEIMSTAGLLDALYGSHDGDSLPLNQHEALRQQLNGLDTGPYARLCEKIFLVDRPL